MKVREIRLTHFKRFTNTTITDIPATAKLVLLAGPNGIGKSSLIDAVYHWHGRSWAQRGGWDENYHVKQLVGVNRQWGNNIEVDFHPPVPATEDGRRKAVYVRSAYRNDPEFQLHSLTQVEAATRETRFARLIDNDMTVSRNYQRLVSQGFEDVFERAAPELTMGQFREQVIGDIRDAMKRLFPELVLNSLGNPLRQGTFKFDKGDSKAFLYMNLSGGEKAAFDLLLDLLIKRREFDDTVFFIDEPEAHVGTALQGALLDELVRAVPDNSQLWLATHSIGMMRKARQIGEAHPGSVAFIDFEGANFDLPTVLRPTQPDRPFWKRAMQLALDDLAGYVAPEQVVLCEGGYLDGGSNFDAECYNTIFAAEFPAAVFLGAGSSNDIQNDPRGVARLVRALAQDVQVRRVIDRDDRTDAEITTLQGQGVRVLTRRHIESYLLDDDVLTRLCQELGNAAHAPQLLAAKAGALADSVAANGPADDLKRIAGNIYNRVKQLFPERKLGSNSRAFMKSFCAPLISLGTETYAQLRNDIFG